MIGTPYNPDILSCIANLSNDEVFTPPAVANAMLDLLPQELFSDPDAKFLDPACKSGVFLREIAKRLIKGLEGVFPNLEERLAHIYRHQLYGIAITELTAQLSRRGLYCSRHPSGPYSVAPFADTPREAGGNVRFRPLRHTWEGGKCAYCGASRSQFDRPDDLESHAYEFIHTGRPQDIFKMKFDVIITNPPYQLSFGIEGANSANARSIYNEFIDKAVALHPKFICMITPSRWMTKTAQGIPDSWVEAMLRMNQFEIVHDFENANDCFPGVEIKGGVNYFLINGNYNGDCKYYYHPSGSANVLVRIGKLDPKNTGIVIRNPKAYSIIEKIEAKEGSYYIDQNRNFSGLVSAKHFFDDSSYLTSNWNGYKDKKSEEYNIKYYLNIDRVRTYKWISLSQLPKNQDTKDLWKVFIPAAGGSGSDDVVLGKPFVGEPNSVCSQTYLVIGYDVKKHSFSQEECENIIWFLSTKFVRYLVSIKKKTQNGPRGVYQFVPILDFHRKWTDEELYERYELSDDEINMIEDRIAEVNYFDTVLSEEA